MRRCSRTIISRTKPNSRLRDEEIGPVNFINSASRDSEGVSVDLNFVRSGLMWFACNSRNFLGNLPLTGASLIFPHS